MVKSDEVFGTESTTCHCDRAISKIAPCSQQAKAEIYGWTINHH